MSDFTKERDGLINEIKKLMANKIEKIKKDTQPAGLIEAEQQFQKNIKYYETATKKEDIKDLEFFKRALASTNFPLNNFQDYKLESRMNRFSPFKSVLAAIIAVTGIMLFPLALMALSNPPLAIVLLASSVVSIKMAFELTKNKNPVKPIANSINTINSFFNNKEIDSTLSTQNPMQPTTK